MLAAGISLAFLTGDLFNLFVAFEVMLVASYVLLTLDGGGAQVRAGMTYVVVSLLASVLFVTAVGLVYAATGTVNMADAADRMAELPQGVRVALGLTLLVVFGIKAAIFPLFSWLPDSYPTAPSPVTAVFAGLLTKVGVYAILRTQTLLFPGEGAIAAVLLVLAVLTMVVGILGALVQDDLERLLSFTIVSHIGYMLLGLGLYSVAGLAGAILYTVHHIVVQTTLFLVAGLVERREGTSSHRPQRRPAAAGAAARGAVPAAGAVARRHPAAVRVHRQARPRPGRRRGRRRAAAGRRRGRDPHQPADAARRRAGCGATSSGARSSTSCRTPTARTPSRSASPARRGS